MDTVLHRLRRWLWGRSIAGILRGIVLLAALPALAVIVATSFEARRQAEAQAQEALGNLASSLAAIQQSVDNQAQAVLVALAHTEAVRDRDMPACNRLFSALLADHPEMSNLFLTDGTGRVLASGLPAFLGVDLSDRGYFRTAMRGEGMGISRYILGRATRKPILAFALAEAHSGEGSGGVIGLSYFLEGYERFLAGLALPPHVRVSLLDPDGRRMLTYPVDAQFPLGKPVRPHIWAQCLASAADAGFFIETRQNGAEGLFRFVRLRLEAHREPYMTIVVATNRSDAYRSADAWLRRGLALAVLALLLALGIARLAGRAAIVRGLVTLDHTVARLADGDLTARVAEAGGSLEVRRLGTNVNTMAAALERREGELAQAVAALGKMRSMLNNILESMPSAIVGLDGTGHVTHLNAPAVHLFGLEKDQAMGRAASESLPLLAEYMQTVRRALQERRALTVEKLALPQEGGTHFMDLLFYPLIANGTEGVVIRFDDVTDRERALEEKNILLKEIHHRVKNNLQIILSFIGLQGEETDDPAERDRLRRLELRIRSMALVHQQLYNDADVAAIDMARYLETLAKGVLAIFPELSPRVRLRLELEPFRLALDKAVPCGLLVGELLTNACKHAFAPEATGTLRVGCRLEGQTARIWVTDDGRGLPPDVVFAGVASMGLTLVRELAHQLQGDVALSRAPGGGVQAELAFPTDRAPTAAAPPLLQDSRNS